MKPLFLGRGAFYALTVGLSLLALSAALAQSFSASSRTMPDEVPLFTLADYRGNKVSLADLRGKVVLINFWATWCPPCVAEMPTLQALSESFSDRPFAVLAINMAEDREAIEAFLAHTKMRLDFPLLVDPGGTVASDYNVLQLPATLLVDRDGMFAFGGIGERDWNSEAVKSEILPLFD